MIWLTWRQFRVNAVVTAVVLAAITIVLAVTHTPHITPNLGTKTCDPNGACGIVVHGGLNSFFSHTNLDRLLSTALVAVPALIGAFWGAPLVARELENGTFRLAWTQGPTRTRWLATKLAVVGLAGVVATGLLTLALTWRSEPDLNPFNSGVFGERGIAPMGYAAFGIALGVAAGVLIRRTLPAMAATLVAFIAARIAVQMWVRPHFASPRKIVSSMSSVGNGPGIQAPKARDWTISNTTVNAAGHAVNQIRCPALVTRQAPTAAEIQRFHASNDACFAQYHQILTYQPANRYWTFQIYETALFVVVAAALVGLSFWWVRNRLT